MKCSGCRNEIEENDGLCGTCVTNIDNDHEEALDDLRDVIKELEEEVRELKQRNDDLLSENDDLKEEVDTLEGRLRG